LIATMETTEGDPGRTLRTLLVRVPLEERYLARLRDRFPDLDVVVATTDDQFGHRLADADAVVGWRVTAAEIAAAPRLKWVQTIGAGVEDVIVPELAARGIVLTNNSGVHAPNIAEHLLSLMLAFARRLPHQIRGQVAHEWRDESGRRGLFELGGQTLIVVGLGDIGQALASRANALGMRVIGVRRRGLEATKGVERVVAIGELASGLAEADHVAICLPLTAETRGLFDAAVIEAMKPGAYLYNIGRGPIVITEALIEGLRTGHLGGAGLDVTDPEPLPNDSPLWDLENVIITSHTSGATPRYWDRAIAILESNIARFRAGDPLLNVVDLDAGY
jgi:phosphoglycerate dehydrogenase-like enzyme